jgi:hypothetical protein
VSAKDSDKSIEELNAFLRIGIAFLREKGPEDRENNPLMHNG